MSPSLKEFGRRLDDLFTRGAALVNEGATAVVVSGLSAADAAEVVALANEAGLNWSCEDDAQGKIVPGDEFDAALQPFRLTVDKPAEEAVAVLFTLVGLRQWLERDVPGRSWKHARSERPFSTCARRFLTWSEQPTGNWPEVRRPEPRELVREAGEPSVPSRIEPWLLDMPLSHMPVGDPVFDEWASNSVRVARWCLANEILVDGTIVYTGPPKLKLGGKPASPVTCELIRGFQRALRWIYETEHQAEIRHGLMSAELARHAIDGEVTSASLSAAVEGAKIAYQLSLSDISKDSLKAIADVRKAVTDEINKTADTARQLATAVAGAVFLGLGVVAARVASSAPPAILIALSVVLAAYVGAIIFASSHYMGLQERLRSDWKQRFYSFLGADDYKTLVTDPLAEAKRGFDVVAWLAGAISFLMVVVVVILVATDFSQRPHIEPVHQPAQTAVGTRP